MGKYTAIKIPLYVCIWCLESENSFDVDLKSNKQNKVNSGWSAVKEQKQQQ